jgi:hypothetical protein
MAAFATVVVNRGQRDLQFYLGEKPNERFPGVYPENLVEVQLDGTN